jgi:hypothetical protein
MVVKETFLICDGGCGKNFGVDCRERSAKKQRVEAMHNGWVMYKGKDYCADCQPMLLMSPREKAML